MSTQTVRAVLEHQVAVGDAVALEGWVRSRRTSKGGFSFLHVNDGSSLDSVQVVADGALDNYESEIVELGTGCSVRVHGTVAESQGKGHAAKLRRVEHEYGTEG